MTAEHPTFPNPTIREALCEIHFDLPIGASWEPGLFSKFYKHIEQVFPEMEPVTEPALQLQIQPGKVDVMPSRSRMRYRHASRGLLLQLSQGVLTINVLPKYEGWQRMKADILQAWKWAQETFGRVEVRRIGLRYINFIPRSNDNEPPITWLAPNDYVGKAVLMSGPGYLSRVEVHPEALRRILVTVGEAIENDQLRIVLDIDCIAETDGSTVLPLEQTLSSLHDDMVWDIFSRFLTPRYRALLEGGPL